MTKRPKIWIFVVIVWEEYRVLPDLGKSWKFCNEICFFGFPIKFWPRKMVWHAHKGIFEKLPIIDIMSQICTWYLERRHIHYFYLNMHFFWKWSSLFRDNPTFPKLRCRVWSIPSSDQDSDMIQDSPSLISISFTWIYNLVQNDQATSKIIRRFQNSDAESDHFWVQIWILTWYTTLHHIYPLVLLEYAIWLRNDQADLEITLFQNSDA